MIDTPVTTPGYKHIRAEYNMMDDGDVWGTALEWHFACADILYHYDPDMVPASWQFRHGPLCEGIENGYEQDMMDDLLDEGIVDTDDIRAFGNVMERYLNILRKAGRSY